MSYQRSRRHKQNAEIINRIEYVRQFWTEFDYTLLDHIMKRRQKGKGESKSFNDIIIMADTETSKKVSDCVCVNHVCLWTITLRAYNHNIATLYGTRPSDMIECIDRIHNSMQGELTKIHFHNMSYDYVFLRKFMFRVWGNPKRQLNTKSNYPVSIEFDNGLIFRDTLILSQRSLEKWANDLDVEHKKAVGLWNYDTIRNQDYEYSEDELTYAEFDTVSGAECIDTFAKQINKDITTIPFTSTGIVRDLVRKIGKKNNAHEQFLRICIDKYELLEKAIRVCHGGYTHANRYIINMLIDDSMVTCYDFGSSYPYCMLSEKYPIERYVKINQEHNESNIEEYYYADYSALFTFKITNVRLKDRRYPMPALQFSKCISVINPILDNGRILEAAYAEIDINEVDFMLLKSMYDWDYSEIDDVYVAKKDYLPRWFTDFVYEKYTDKCKLKFGEDRVAYDISKTIVNSLYGMSVQKPCPDDIKEDYETGEYYVDPVLDPQAVLDKHNKKWGSMLPYQWGLYVTSYAMRNLFELGACAGRWLYSDTDSVYGQDWDIDAIQRYNNRVDEKMKANGYSQFEYDGHTFNLGHAELDGTYTAFKTMGAKRYVCQKMDGTLKLTVAGVPKKTGVNCLNNDINNFIPGLIFDGQTTKKKTHTYIYSDNIYTDENGNEIGDSIDLSPCDYLLGATDRYDWDYEELIGVHNIECLDDGRIF